MNQITGEIKHSFESWKVKIASDLFGDQYKSKMEKRIINNDEVFDNLVNIVTIRDKNQLNNESTLFLRIKSTFDKSIFLQLAESVCWKRFTDFPLPNEASML